MTRADKSRLAYALVLGALFLVSYGLAWRYDFEPRAVVIIGLVLLVPGRLPTLFWSEFYRGQEQLRLGAPERAAASFQEFLAKVRARPWLKWLIYGKWGVNTWDIEAMTLNNLGSTYVERGNPTQAARFFEAALALDPNYGVPYSNLALLAYASGDEAEGDRLLEHSNALGNRHLTRAQAQERAALFRAKLERRM